MGMCDELRCHYPLPVAGANARVYQTKDLACRMDAYEIRADGTLWHAHDDGRWAFVPLTGEVRFYDLLRREEPRGWIEWSASFKDGALQHVNLVELEQPPVRGVETKKVEP